MILSNRGEPVNNRQLPQNTIITVKACMDMKTETGQSVLKIFHVWEFKSF